MAARVSALAGLLLAAATLAGCGAEAADGDTTLTVYAAASLRSTFEELGERFESEHDGVEVVFSFAGSSTLVGQVRQGADADVVATADTATMGRLEADGLLAGGPRDFASNTLEIAVPPGNPAGIESFQDLAGGDVRLVVCAPEVPCGAAAEKAQDLAGIDLAPVSEEQSVTDVLGKVVTGEADAGLVYVTDVEAAGDRVEGVPFPGSTDVVNIYPIATVADTDQPDLARQFVRMVLGSRGRSVLQDAGFSGP
jgi:molybdate transport system substrate-binding protein